MRTSGMGRHDGAVAWMLLLVLHGSFGWMLTRVARIETPLHADAALQVVYVESIAHDSRRERRELSIAPGKSGLPATRSGRIAPTTSPRVPADAAPNETPSRSLSAVFIEQARQSIAHQEDAGIAPVDPFASRKAALPGADGGRFRMRVQRSPADIVQAVGTYLFAPPGYDPDPCPRNRANIQGLITQGDSPALQYELEFERKHCRS